MPKLYEFEFKIPVRAYANITITAQNMNDAIDSIALGEYESDSIDDYDLDPVEELRKYYIGKEEVEI